LGDTYVDFCSVRATTSGPDLRGDVDGRADRTRHVAHIPTGGSLVHTKLSACGQPKVSNLDVLDTVWPSADENVLGLEISVHNVEAVDMGKAFEDLAKESPNFLGVLGEVASYQVAQCLGCVSFRGSWMRVSTNLLASRSTPSKCT
jgi:hypothetical protein